MVKIAVDPADNVLKILEEDHYYPFGLKHEGYSANQQIITRGGGGTSLFVIVPVINAGDATYKYMYNGKELQDELQLNNYDFGARNYDPAIGRWMNIDPLAENSRRWTPYNYCYNSPMIFKDPDGMQAENDYGLNIDGDISLIRETNDPTDKLIVLDKNGAETSKSLEVEKGIFDNIKSDTSYSTGKDYNYIEMKGDEKATELFEFVSQNTQVEWSQTKFGDDSNYIATAHEPASEAGGADLMYKLKKENKPNTDVRQHNHNHPNVPNGLWAPSGFVRGMGGGDKQVAEWVKEYYPNATLRVYVVATGKYIEYDDKEIKK